MKNKTLKEPKTCLSDVPMIGTHEITVEDVIVTEEKVKPLTLLQWLFPSRRERNPKKKIRVRITTPDIIKLKPKQGDIISSPVLFKINCVGHISIFATSERYLSNEEIASAELFNGIGKLWKV